MGELESFDTTLFFVCLFVPLIPLGKKRILEQCPYCRKHRLLPLKKWEESKKRDTADLLQRLHASPDDKSVMLRAIQLSMAYQDPAMLDQLAEVTAETGSGDATILGQLGFAYAYFARWESAAKAFEASLSLRDDPEIHRQLGHTLLKLGRTDEAEPHLRPILTEREGQNAPLIYFLIEAYQAEGRHDKALELADERDAAFPELANDKLNKKQRAASQRYLGTEKRLKPVFISESGQTGFREGNWTARLPLIIGPLVVVGLLAWYLIAAVVEGHSRRVYLVNSWDAPYTAMVNGEAHTLQPGRATPINVAEGEISVSVSDGNPGIQPFTVHVETPFFSRPFSRHTFVINPDQLAVLSLEEIEYAQAPPPRKPGKLYAGESLHNFEKVDYEFTAPPATVQIKHNQSVFKKLLELVPSTADNRLFVAMAIPDHAAQIRYGKHWVELDAANEEALAWTFSMLPDEDGLTFLRGRLAERPPLIGWHRAYQTQMDKLHPEVDIRPEYRRLVEETKDNPDALYLLGRLEDGEESDKLFEQAAAANPPSVYAMYARGYDAMCRGQFEDAVARFEAARKHKPQFSVLVQHFLHEAYLATGRYDQLLADLTTKRTSWQRRFVEGAEQIHALAAKGDKDKARTVVDEMARELAPQGDMQQLRQALQKVAESSICCAANDTAGFLKAVGNEPSFEAAFLQGKYAAAAVFADKGKQDNAMNQRGLLYLGLLKSGDPKSAEEQWQPFLDALQKEGRRGRQCAEVLAGKRPVDVEQLRRLALEPRNKRVVLAVIAKRYPEKSKDLLTLARKLDYHRDATSLCLRKVLE
jgi:tetratricopeptide (TPR) repeat protein